MTLIEQLESAAEGSRALDAQIASQHGGFGGMGYETWDAIEADCPHYTTSLDAALTLVPEGREWSVTYLWDGRCGGTCDGHHADFKGATPALALCIAALKARQAMEGGT